MPNGYQITDNSAVTWLLTAVSTTATVTTGFFSGVTTVLIPSGFSVTVGQTLYVDVGKPNGEAVVVSAVGGGTFTALFGFDHASPATILMSVQLQISVQPSA